MARVLFAWEFGGDLGHVRRLIPIARELRSMGHEPLVAFRDSALLETAWSAGIEGFVAPLLRVPPQVSPSPLNFSDILLNLGFEDRHGLAGALRAWRSLFALAAPDVLVCDYAPTALFAAAAAGLARVTIGSGFSQPRLEDPLPSLRPWIEVDAALLRDRDARLLATVHAAMKDPGSSLPARACDLFSADAHLISTFPELDPFGARDGAEYVGPQGDASSGEAVDWRGDRGQRVFAYLKARDARFGALLAALGRLDAEVIVAAPDLAPEAARAASTPAMRVIAAAVNLERVLPRADLCVGHGGAGLSARALAAGVPMALLPMQLEQFLVARRLEEARSAEVLPPEGPMPDFHAWLTRLLGRSDLREAARAHALPHRGHCFEDATRLAARRIAQVARA
jgi:UDP:flavonoid glycosyltransferase YjiC (YdhE family)